MHVRVKQSTASGPLHHWRNHSDAALEGFQNAAHFGPVIHQTPKLFVNQNACKKREK